MSIKEGKSTPALRISHLAYGREKRGNRVVYLLEPKSHAGGKGVAEAVVLYRWRRRIYPNHRFSGARLGPNLWRAVGEVFGPDVSRWWRLSEEEVARRVEAGRAGLGVMGKSLPGSGVLWALFQVCGPERLKRILVRHGELQRAGRYGTPDLFLYAIDQGSNRPVLARFVEVKKPEEPSSKDQIEEIAFLKSIGLQARVLRLLERDG